MSTPSHVMRKLLISAVIACLVPIAAAPTVSATVRTDSAVYQPGDLVHVSGDNGNGQGYAPGQQVTVWVAPPFEYLACLAWVASDGTWACMIGLPTTVPTGTYTYSVSSFSPVVGPILESGSFSVATCRSSLRAPQMWSARCAGGARVVINESGPASPYASTLDVSDVPGVLWQVTVVLESLSHQRPDDVDIVLAGPEGTSSIVLSDVGGTTPIPASSGVTLIIDDLPESPVYLPDNGPLLTDGQHRHSTNASTWGDDTDPFASPAPSTSLADLHAFNGISPNGEWRLYAVDDEAPYGGELLSWSLQFETWDGLAPEAPQDDFNIVQGMTAPPALLAINDGYRYLVRDPASRTFTDPDGDGPTVAAPNVPMKYDYPPLQGIVSSVAVGDWDRDDAQHATGVSDGQEVIVVYGDGAAELMDDASATSSGDSGGYRSLAFWPKATGVVAAAFLNWGPSGTGDDIALVTRDSAGVWRLELYADSSYAGGPTVRIHSLTLSPWAPEGARVLDVDAVPGTGTELILTVAMPTGAGQEDLVLIRMSGLPTLTTPDAVEWNGHSYLTRVTTVGSADVDVVAEPTNRVVIAVSADTGGPNHAVFGGTLTKSTNWAVTGAFSDTCEHVTTVRPSVAAAPAGTGAGAATVSCAMTAGTSGGAALAVKSWRMTSATETQVQISEIAGDIVDPTLGYMRREADTAGVTLPEPTALWEVGFISQEGAVKKLRFAGVDQNLDAAGIPQHATSRIVAPKVLPATSSAFVMTPVALAPPVVTLHRTADRSIVELTPLPVIVLAAPPKVLGLGQQTALGPAYTTGTVSGSGTGRSTELNLDLIAQIRVRDPLFDAGIDAEYRLSTAIGWNSTTNSMTRIEDFYIGTTDEDAVVVNRSTMWKVPYEIISSSDGLGIGEAVDIYAPRTTVLAVETLARLQDVAPELFGLTGDHGAALLQASDWWSVLPHHSGNPQTYPRAGLAGASCRGSMVSAVSHDVVEGSPTTEGSRISFNEETVDEDSLTLGLSTEIVAGAVFNLGFGVSSAIGKSWTTTSGTNSAFEGYVGNIPHVVDGWAEEYAWKMFVCKQRLGPLDVWVADYAVDDYDGRGGYVALGAVDTVSPGWYESVTTLPTFRWTGGGTVKAYELDVRGVGAPGGFLAQIPVPGTSDVGYQAQQTYTPPDQPGFWLEPGMTYQWRVRSHGYFGNSEVSEWSYLRVPVGNAPPSVTLSNKLTILSEDADTTSATNVADIVLTDDGQGVNTLSLSGPDAAQFMIDAGQLFLKAGVALDSDANPVLDVTVAVNDATVGGNPDASASLSIVVVPTVGGGDTTPPTTSVLTQTPDASGALVGSAIPLMLRWQAATDAGSGLADIPYELERSLNGGTWTLVGTYAGTSAKAWAASSGTVRYRVRAVDSVDNKAAWAYTPTLSPRLTQQSSSAVKYRGTWTNAKSSSYSGGSARYAKVAGRSASYTFTGRSIALVTTQATSRGRVKIYINGTAVKTVDLYRSSTRHRSVVWEKTWTTAASRTIKIVVVGTANRPRVDLDAFVVLK